MQIASFVRHVETCQTSLPIAVICEASALKGMIHRPTSIHVEHERMTSRHVAPHGLVPWERKFGWLGRPSLANQTLLPTGQAGGGASQ